jgi:hypothetical protein
MVVRHIHEVDGVNKIAGLDVIGLNLQHFSDFPVMNFFYEHLLLAFKQNTVQF